MRAPGDGAYRGRVNYYGYNGPERFYGEPHLAPRARVHFAPEKLFGARERRAGRPVNRRLAGNEGLVVEEEATGLLVWPESLWRVDGLERPVRLLPGNKWVRCLAFTVVEQVPTWLVAGPHGDYVEWVISRARTLTAEEVDALAALPDEDEEDLYRALWARWSENLRSSGSPIGCSPLTLSNAVTEAARRAGPQLFGWDEDDEVEVLSDPEWLGASKAAYSAALALGAPELVSPKESAVLTRRWTTVFGRPDLPGR